MGQKIINTASKYLGRNGSFIWQYWSGLTSGASWCVGFVLFCIYKSIGKKYIYDVNKVSAPFWVPTIEEWLHKHATHVKMADAKAGDIVIFTWTGNGNNSRKIGICSRDHVGFIRKKGTSKVCYTIEGNTSGGKVAERTRYLTNVFAIYRLDCCKEKKKTNRGKLFETAMACAWKADKGEEFWGEHGKAKKAYRTLLDKVFPYHNKWKWQIRKGQSCAVFAAVVARGSGVDKSFPCRNPDDQADYMRKSDKWKKTTWSKAQAGDFIVYQTSKSSAGHIMIYKTQNYLIEAVYAKAYPHVKKVPKRFKTKAGRKSYYKFAVYRRK